MTCEGCPKRDGCTSLCNKASEYVEPERLPDDFVRQFQEDPEHWPVAPGSKKYQIAAMYFLDHKTEKEISDHFSLTQPYVSKIISKVKGFMEDL